MLLICWDLHVYLYLCDHCVTNYNTCFFVIHLQLGFLYSRDYVFVRRYRVCFNSYHLLSLKVYIVIMPTLIQFNSKTLFKDGDPVSLQPIFPGAIQTWKQIHQLFIHIYKTKHVHQTITGKHNLHFHTKHKHSY